MKNRIFTLIDSKQITPTEFAHIIGISPAAISSIKTGRTQPTLALVEKIKQCYPDVDVNWLIFGEGELNVVNTSKEDEALGGLFESENAKNEEAHDYQAVYVAEQPKFVDNKVNTHKEEEKTTVRQIKKIVVLYSDGTFEEFDKNVL